MYGISAFCGKLVVDKDWSEIKTKNSKENKIPYKQLIII